MNFDLFLNVTLAPVTIAGRASYELRLYLPNQFSLNYLPMLRERALAIFDQTTVPDYIIPFRTLEYNRAGMCFCAPVDPTQSLIDHVNAWRKAKNLRPIRFD